MAPRWSQDGRKTPQDGSKMATRRVRDDPRPPQDVPGRLKTVPRRPKITPRRSKTPQDRFKTPENRSKTAPKVPLKGTPPQDHSKTTSLSDLGPDVVLSTKLVPVLVHDLMRNTATDLVPISFSSRAEVNPPAPCGRQAVKEDLISLSSNCYGYPVMVSGIVVCSLSVRSQKP